MKITRLSMIDVANAAALPPSARYEHLVSIEEPRVRWGYDPVANNLPKLLAAKGDLLQDLAPDHDEHLVDAVRKSCKSGPRQIDACTAVATALIAWRKSHDVKARRLDPNPLKLPADTLSYCCNLAVSLGGEPFIFAFDPRSKMSLSRRGRDLLHSLLFHHGRTGNAREASVALLRVPSIGGGVRKVIFDRMEGSAKFEFDEVIDRINGTYAIWSLILRQRKEAASARSA